MCRLAALAGPTLPLSTALFDAPHSLYEQAIRPREQLKGRVNVDGTGIAWWRPGEEQPLRYRTDGAPWADENLVSLAPRLAAPLQLAAVRSATPGMPYSVGNAAPFIWGPLAMAHNGWIGEFRTATMAPLLQRLPADVFAAFDAVSDSLVLFLTLVAAWRDDPSAGLAGAARRTVATVAEVCRTAGAAAALTFAVGDGVQVVAVRTGIDTPANTMYSLTGGQRFAGANLLASEALDDDEGWTAVPPESLVRLSAAGVSAEPLHAPDERTTVS